MLRRSKASEEAGRRHKKGFPRREKNGSKAEKN